MTKVELQKKCFELLHATNLRLMAVVPEAIALGGLDYEAEPADTYRLAKIIVAAVVAAEADRMVESLGKTRYFRDLWQVRMRLWQAEKEKVQP